MCWCVAAGDSASRYGVQIAGVRPHDPESQRLQLMEEDTPLLSSSSTKGGGGGGLLKHNLITDLFTSQRGEFSLPFNFVHFPLSRLAPIASSHRLVAHHSCPTPKSNHFRRISLVYHSPSKGYDLVLTGTASVVSSPAYRRHYWLPRWGAVFSDHKSKEYILVKLTVDELALHMTSDAGPHCWRPIILRRDISETTNHWRLASPSHQQAKQIPPDV